ncbi:MAG: hypothetical protein J6S13_07255 [Clostridia bacterium]|nr:hypothetical protein [Clostridia bacterium]
MSDNSTVIKELHELRELTTDFLSNNEKLEELKDTIDKESKKAVKKRADEMRDYLGNASRDMCEAMPNRTALAKNVYPKNDGKEPSKTAAIIGLVFYLGVVLYILATVLNLGAGFAVLISAVVLFGGITWFFMNGKATDVFDWQKKFDEWHKKVDAENFDREKFLENSRAYYDKFSTFKQEADAKFELLNNKLEVDVEAVNQKYADELERLNNRLSEDCDALDKVTVLHKDYFYLAGDVALLLESGRADTLKEALNLALEEERKANEEAQRRREAQRQQDILSEQARQTALHNQAMERAAAEQAKMQRDHNAAMEAQAKQQLQETEKIRKELEKQNK